jgi:quercetin dioxygenase-like cupin family protein
VTDDSSIVDPDDVPTDQFQTCETAVRKLTEPPGCTELRVNQVIVEPGEVTTPHTHDGQEEVFVSTNGGQISLAGEVHDVPAGGRRPRRPRDGQEPV